MERGSMRLKAVERGEGTHRSRRTRASSWVGGVVRAHFTVKLLWGGLRIGQEQARTCSEGARKGERGAEGGRERQGESGREIGGGEIK